MSAKHIDNNPQQSPTPTEAVKKKTLDTHPIPCYHPYMPRPKLSKPPKPKRPDPVPRILAICPHCDKPVPEPTLGPLAKYRTPSELDVAINTVVQDREDHNQPLTVAGLAYGLGFMDDGHFATIMDRCRESKPAFAARIKRAIFTVQRHCEQILVCGKPVNVAGVMFYGKNRFGWRDVKDIREEHSGQYTIVITQGDPAPRPALTKGGKGGPDNPGGSMVECQVVDIVDDAK